MGSAQPVECQRGFTMLDVAVACAVVAILAVAAVAIGQAIRPSALRAALDGYDASLAAARALASAGGDGATLVFAPRFGPAGARLPGFLLRVYAGRPNDPARMHPGSSLPVIARADVTSPSLGAPPFSIFVNASGHASGRAGYPAFAADGTPRFSTIAREPPCAGEIVLRFRTPTAEETRAIACSGSLADAVGSTPMPYATPTPERPLLTPTALVFYWPTAPRAHFVATEWGYTRWFAVPDGFNCAGSGGSTIAAFPRTAPAPPYSPPHDDAAALATPPPPADLPYSYPNAPDSMEDAPAWFYLDPVAPGLCTLRVTDAFAQNASASVRVMGWLTLQDGGAAADASPGGGILVVPQVLRRPGSSASVAIVKAFDDAPAQTFPAGRRAVAFCSAAGGAPCSVDCTPFLNAQVEDVASGGSQRDLTARLVVQVVGNGNVSGSRVTCRGSVTDALGEPPAHFAVMVDPVGDAAGTLRVWPAHLAVFQGGWVPVIVQTMNLPSSPGGAQPLLDTKGPHPAYCNTLICSSDGPTPMPVPRISPIPTPTPPVSGIPSAIEIQCSGLALNSDGHVATQRGPFTLPEGQIYALDPQSGCLIQWSTSQNFWKYISAYYPDLYNTNTQTYGIWQTASVASPATYALAVSEDTTTEYQQVNPPNCLNGSVGTWAVFPSNGHPTISLEAQWSLPGLTDPFWSGTSCTATFTAGSLAGVVQKTGSMMIESFSPCPQGKYNPAQPAGYICVAQIPSASYDSACGSEYGGYVNITTSGVRIYLPNQASMYNVFLSPQSIPVPTSSSSLLNNPNLSPGGSMAFLVKTTSAAIQSTAIDYAWTAGYIDPSSKSSGCQSPYKMVKATVNYSF